MRSAGAGHDDAGSPTADPGQALLRWLNRPDPHRSDAILVALLTTVSFVGLIAGIKIGHPAWPAYRDPDLLGVVLVLSQVAPLLVIRRYPTTACAVTGTAYLLSDLAGVPPLPAGAVVLLTLYLGIVHCRTVRQLAGFGGVVGVVAVLHGVLLVNLGLPLTVVFTRVWLAVLVVVAGIAGRTVVARSRAVAAADAQLAAAIRAAVLRDLHDGVTHGLTAVVVQAEAAHTRLSASNERCEPLITTAAALTTIASVSRQSLADLRQLLATLDHGPGPRTGGSGPRSKGVADLPDLLSRAAPLDQSATLRVDGRPRPLPAAVDQALFRVVQESVTNALRHAGATSDVTIGYREDVVEVIVDNDRPSPGDALPAGTERGRGTTSMRERVHACGGVLAAGPRADGTYRVHATFPAPTRPR